MVHSKLYISQSEALEAVGLSQWAWLVSLAVSLAR